MRALLIISVWLGMVGCSKESSNHFFPYTGHELNDTTWHQQVSMQARVRSLDAIFALPTLRDSVDVANGDVLYFGDSLRVIFPPGFCTTGSITPYTGKVEISITKLDSKGDMIRAARPTMSYDRLLVTGGALHISASSNGIPVQMSPGAMIDVSFITKMSNTSPSQNMHVFFGKEDAFPPSALQNFTWIPSQDSLNSWVSLYQDSITGKKGYQFFSDRFGWINVDYFSDTTQPRTKAVVTLPPNFTNANTAVYAVFQTPDIVAQLYPDPSSKTFHINNIYTGKVVTFVTISDIGGELFLGAKTVTISPNITVQVLPDEKTKQEINLFLNTL